MADNLTAAELAPEELAMLNAAEKLFEDESVKAGVLPESEAGIIAGFAIAFCKSLAALRIENRKREAVSEARRKMIEKLDEQIFSQYLVNNPDGEPPVMKISSALLKEIHDQIIATTALAQGGPDEIM